jgi:hypothetical protein
MTTFKDLNKGADSWRKGIGANVFPADSKNKITYEQWKGNGWQDNPIPLEQHEQWKKDGSFAKGFMVMPGIPWHTPNKTHLYLTCIEWDLQAGFDELFEGKPLEQVCKEYFIEQHADDLTRGHLWIYSPIIFPKKSADNILGIEVKGLASHGVIIPTPCIHKDGHTIESVGRGEPTTWNKEEAFGYLFHINKICKKYNIPYLDKNGNTIVSPLSEEIKNMLRSLSKDLSVEIPYRTRHDTMLSVAAFTILRHWKTKSHDKLKEYFMWINEHLCKPDPLPETEILTIWEDSLRFISGIQNLEQETRSPARTITIQPEIEEALKDHKWAFKRYNPTMTFIVAESKLNQIVEGCVKSTEISQNPLDPNSQKLKKYFLSLREIHINAIPIEVTTYEDPISITLDRRYKIKFKTSVGRIFTSRAHSTLDAIVAELLDKALVYSAQEGKEALSRIVNAFENDGSMRISREIETPGFYLIDDTIRAFQIELKDYTQKELAEAARFMNELVEKHYRKEIPATTIKWSTVAPFDYALKQYTDDLCWIPWLGLAGWPRSGKGTQGRIACGMWGDFYHGIKNYLPFTAINTEARLGQKIGQCTLPLTFNECDALNDDKNKNILEMIKNCMETRISRGKYETRTTYIDEPALSLHTNIKSCFSFRTWIQEQDHVHCLHKG